MLLGLLLLAGVFAESHDSTLQLILFNNSYVHDTGARCLDGTNAGYYFRPNKSTKNPNAWVFYLQGGGLCVEPIDCYKRKKSGLGSSSYWGQTVNQPNGVLSNDPNLNPFYDFNHVYIRYCSGDTHTGTDGNGTSLLGFTFAGHLILEAVVRHLKATTEIASAPQMLISGGSAGGIGVFNNLDWFASQFPKTKVKGLPEAGYFFSPNIVLYEEWILGINTPYGKIAADYLSTWFNSYHDPDCVNAYPDNPKWCWLAGLVYPHVQTEMLIANNIFDSSQLQFVGWINDGGTNSKGFQAWFGNDVVTSISAQVAAPNKTKDGYWLPGCYDHTGNLCMGSQTKVQGYIFKQIVEDWYFEINKLPHRLVDECWVSGKGPCNTVCPSFCG